jgi:hypothetical protein
MFWNIYSVIVLIVSFVDIILCLVYFATVKGPYVINRKNAVIMVFLFHMLFSIPLAGKILGLW